MNFFLKSIDVRDTRPNFVIFFSLECFNCGRLGVAGEVQKVGIQEIAEVLH